MKVEGRDPALPVVEGTFESNIYPEDILVAKAIAFAIVRCPDSGVIVDVSSPMGQENSWTCVDPK